LNISIGEKTGGIFGELAGGVCPRKKHPSKSETEGKGKKKKKKKKKSNRLIKKAR